MPSISATNSMVTRQPITSAKKEDASQQLYRLWHQGLDSVLLRSTTPCCRAVDT